MKDIKLGPVGIDFILYLFIFFYLIYFYFTCLRCPMWQGNRRGGCEVDCVVLWYMSL